MPLVRVQVKSEFELGNPELYKQANNEDPKAVLDGVAVAGLVGILRQLGDLAEYVSLLLPALGVLISSRELGLSLRYSCLWLFLTSRTV